MHLSHLISSISSDQIDRVGEKVKNTLFSFHKASIGTSDAYCFLRVGLGGFENVGCTLRDLQNYHGKLRCSIKSSDAQMFVDQLRKKALANPADRKSVV